ncbi:MAG: DUF72 domain-containing protein [Phycisphaerales bacterium]|nr:DUF72 domain-containing protein [Phycisphaerae bacterium]NNF42960.1 DUF72 domain-containing protein [Phycisphaerales bacterium]NNM27283.1 DUF72 domain-containing protein [Phycisphaerales bacterium]
MHVWAGTSGYSYKEWKGHFYPEKLAAKDMLAYYAERLSAVEINNTFYRLPRASVLDTWCEQVPDDFRFVIKASRRITHMKRLKDAGEETDYLLTTLTTLGPHLGAVLFQLPPNLKKDLDRFRSFLDLLSPGTKATFEFRHPSWIDDDVLTLLRERDFPLVVNDSDDDEPAVEIIRTAGWGYLRLRRAAYSTADLDRWAAVLREQAWSDAYVFFKHEDEGSGPARALELRERFATA